MSLFLLENSMVKEVDSNGFWRIKDNPLSKEGVFPYLGKQIDAKLEPNKIYWVYRPMSELSKPETVESFNAAPLIDEHEMIGEGWTRYDDRPAGGVIYNTKAKDGKLYGDIRIYSEKLKDEIESGKKELSMGYECTYEPEHGVFEGKEYDFVQRNLRGNHIALVNRGRMGHDVRVYDHFVFDTLEGLGEFVAEDKEYDDDIIGWATSKSGNRYPIRDKNTGSEEHITEISGDEFGEFTGDVDDYKDRFEKYYKKYIAGSDVTNPILGKVEFYINKPIRETKFNNNKTPENLKYIVGVPDLIKHSYYVTPEPVKHPKDGIIRAWRVKGLIRTKNEKPRKVEVVILEDDRQHKYYTFDARTEEQKNKFPRRGSSLPLEGTSADKSAYDNNITQDEYDVNIFITKGYVMENNAMDKEWNESDHPRDEKELSTLDETIPSQDGNPKESGVDSSFNIKGEDTLEKVDKRKGISEVEAMLYEAKKDPAKLTDELIKTILQKMENNSYKASETTKADDAACGKSEDEDKPCKDGCTTKKEDVKDDSGVAKKDAEGEAPTEEKKDEGKKEDKKAEDAMIAVQDALPEILKKLENIEASLKGRKDSKNELIFGLDETPACSTTMDLGLKKYLGE